MCYLDYLEKKISFNCIIIDTCSTMKIDRFIPFMESIKEYLIKYNKKIIILGTVHDELKDKTRSEYFDLKTDACNALNYIYNNIEFFEIRENPTNEAFADPEIQSMMLNERRNKKLLLISNDSNLTKFVFNYNNNDAVNGHYINLCYLDKNGKLRTCDCVKNHNVEESVNQQEPEIKVITEIVEKPVLVTSKTEKTFAEKYLIPTGYFLLGIGTAYLSPKAYHFIKRYATA